MVDELAVSHSTLGVVSSGGIGQLGSLNFFESLQCSAVGVSRIPAAERAPLNTIFFACFFTELCKLASVVTSFVNHYVNELRPSRDGLISEQRRRPRRHARGGRPERSEGVLDVLVGPEWTAEKSQPLLGDERLEQ